MLAVKVSDKAALYRKLPATDELARSLAALADHEGATAVTDACRLVLSRLRAEIAAGRLDDAQLQLALDNIAIAVDQQLRADLKYSLRPVINATGVILHTNLGRAPLSSAALDRIREIAGGYTNLEFDLETGERGQRDLHADRLFAKLLREEAGRAIATLVVNNNAAAVLLMLNALAEGGEVIVSRGELVEIGGSFRIPEVMQKAGCTLKEVGTTNRTRIADFERAITDKTRLLLRVHRSNFEIVGFTEEPAMSELVALARQRNIYVAEDLGSGALFDLASVGIANEPGVSDSLRTGVDMVTYSGDKLLGGPQAGIISGQPALIAKLRANPLFRALRVDKLTYAALEATLLAYVKHDTNTVPALRMMQLSADAIRTRAESLQAAMGTTGLHFEIIAGASLLGGGSAPTATLPTFLLAISSTKLSADTLAARLRANAPPVIARVEDGRVLLDLRTVAKSEEPALISALSDLSVKLPEEAGIHKQ